MSLNLKNDNGSMTYLTILSLIAAIGGFLFGYDTAIISGTISFVKEKYMLDAVSEGWFVSSALVGCIAGVSAAGLLSDKIGRKKSLFLAAVLFSVSAYGCAVANTHTWLIIARFVGGLGIGIASMLSPLYISELSRPKLRGRMVALYQFAITIGILAAYFSNSILLEISQANSNFSLSFINWVVNQEVWRGMFLTELLPAIGFFILLFFVPESPRWLSVNGQEDNAYSILSRISGKETADQQMKEIKEVTSQESGTWKDLLQPGFKLAMIVGIVLAFMTQVSGINAIIYYGPRILNEAGFGLNDALGGQVIIGIVNVLFTLIALWKIDALGRKPLLYFGVTGIIISLIIVGALFAAGITQGYYLLFFILTFIACFAFSFGPVIWVLLSEIYPTKLRGRAMSVATLSLWCGTALVGQMVPWMLDNLTPAGTFWAFAIACSPALLITWKWLPETKGKSLEAIEKFWLEQKH